MIAGISKGPWVARRAPNGHVYIEARGSVEVARVGGENMLIDGSAKANANLLAAAPNLLAALVHARELIDSVAYVKNPGDTRAILTSIDYALAKAGLA